MATNAGIMSYSGDVSTITFNRNATISSIGIACLPSSNIRINVRSGGNETGAGGIPAIGIERASDGGFPHYITSRHTAAAGNTGNAIDIFLNNSATSGGSSTPGVGNNLGLSVTANGVGVGLSTPTVALDVSGQVRAPSFSTIATNTSSILANNVSSLTSQTGTLLANTMVANIIQVVYTSTTNVSTTNVVASDISTTTLYAGSGVSTLTLNASNVTANSGLFTSSISSVVLNASNVTANSGLFTSSISSVVLNASNVTANSGLFTSSISTIVLNASNITAASGLFRSNVSTVTLNASNLTATNGLFTNNLSTTTLNASNIYTSTVCLSTITCGTGTQVAVQGKLNVYGDIYLSGNINSIKPSGGVYSGYFAPGATGATYVGVTAETDITATPFSVGALTVPANGFELGSVFAFKVGGQWTNANNDTIQFRLINNFGLPTQSVLATIPLSIDAANTNLPWEFNVSFIFRRLGPSGTAQLSVNGQFTYYINSYQRGLAINSTTTSGFSTEIQNTLSLTYQTARATMTMVIDQVSLTRLF